MLWLLELFAGMYLAYYCISPRLRGFTNRQIMRLFRKVKPQIEYPKVKARYAFEEETEEVGKPIESVVLGNKQGILVSEDKITEWLSKNPDLVKVNKVKEMVK